MFDLDACGLHRLHRLPRSWLWQIKQMMISLLSCFGMHWGGGSLHDWLHLPLILNWHLCRACLWVECLFASWYNCHQWDGSPRFESFGNLNSGHGWGSPSLPSSCPAVAHLAIAPSPLFCYTVSARQIIRSLAIWPGSNMTFLQGLSDLTNHCHSVPLVWGRRSPSFLSLRERGEVRE